MAFVLMPCPLFSRIRSNRGESGPKIDLPTHRKRELCALNPLHGVHAQAHTSPEFLCTLCKSDVASFTPNHPPACFNRAHTNSVALATMTQVLYWSTYPNGHTLGPPCTNCTDGYTPPGCGSPRGGSPPTYMSWSLSPDVSNSTHVFASMCCAHTTRPATCSHSLRFVDMQSRWVETLLLHQWGVRRAVTQRCRLLDHDSSFFQTFFKLFCTFCTSTLFTRVFGNTYRANTACHSMHSQIMFARLHRVLGRRRSPCSPRLGTPTSQV
jgi:hypothetical protein